MATLTTFPVRHDAAALQADPACPTTVPYAVVEAHVAQAERDHHASLEELAERGGLCPRELFCLVSDMSVELAPAVRAENAVDWVRSLNHMGPARPAVRC